MPLHAFPTFKQSPSFCGPACLKMILEYYGVHATEEELGDAAKTTPELGTTHENLLAAAQAYGLSGTWRNEMQLDDLRAAADRNIPVIVEWFSTNEVHYSVVVEVSDTHIFIQDPETGDKESFTHAEFLSVWFSFSGAFPKDTMSFSVRSMLPLEKDVSPPAHA